VTDTTIPNVFANLPLKGETAAETPAPTVNEPEADEDDETETAAPKGDELSLLKQRATLMGIKFSNNIGVDSLRAKIKAKLEAEDPAEQEDDGDDGVEVVLTEDPAAAKIRALEAQIASLQAGTASAPVSAEVKPVSKLAAKKNKRAAMRKEQMRLVRLRITNLNPAKKDLPGEIFTFANSVLGAVRKFVPYGEATDNGYHVPYCIYQQLKEREFLQIKTSKDSRGREKIDTKWVREFALEELPQLTEVELARLAAQQAAAKGMD
jgi:hypothetical protein